MRTEYLVKLPDGKEAKIYKEGAHYHAINAAGALIGQPFMKLGRLMESLKAVPVGAQNMPTDEELAAPVAALPACKEYRAKNEAGEIITIFFNGTHYRVNAEDGHALSQDYLRLERLLECCKAELVVELTEQPLVPAAPADTSKCGQFREGICAMDNTACDGQCGEHASRAPREAAAGEVNVPPAGSLRAAERDAAERADKRQAATKEHTDEYPTAAEQNPTPAEKKEHHHKKGRK